MDAPPHLLATPPSRPPRRSDGSISFFLLVLSIIISCLLPSVIYRMPALILLIIVPFSFSIGFGTSGLRQGGVANRIIAALTLGLIILFLGSVALP